MVTTGQVATDPAFYDSPTVVRIRVRRLSAAGDTLTVSGLRIRPDTAGSAAGVVTTGGIVGVPDAATIETIEIPDTSPPIVVPAVTGTLGNGGWYVSDVTVSWDVSDPESAIASTSGCEPSTVTADTAGVTFTCEATSAGGTASESATIKRDATPPAVVIVSPADFAVEPVGLTVDFTASDALSGLPSVEALLDDGGPAVPIASGTQIVEPGIYELTVTADDSAGNETVETRMFVVYDPSAGFATGGGWIIPGGGSSDPGDQLPGLDSASKATFGFVVRYKTGASTNPSGQLEFQYHVGDFNLHSTEYEWLVVTNGNWAKFQGLATISGLEGLFPFRVDARDGDNAGGSLADRFVIKIWAPGANPDVDEPIYKASGDLGGGAIKIHK